MCVWFFFAYKEKHCESASEPVRSSLDGFGSSWLPVAKKPSDEDCYFFVLD